MTRYEEPQSLKDFGVELCDFRHLSRDQDLLQTTISLTHYRRSFPWIKCGQIRLTKRDRTDEGEIWILDAYLQNAKDFEHSSAYIFRMALIAVQWRDLSYGFTTVSGTIRPRESEGWTDFGVPPPDYNPLTLPNTVKCKECKGPDKHVIVPEGNYVPKFNPDLYRKVEGRRIEIVSGAIRPKENE